MTAAIRELCPEVSLHGEGNSSALELGQSEDAVLSVQLHCIEVDCTVPLLYHFTSDAHIAFSLCNSSAPACRGHVSTEKSNALQFLPSHALCDEAHPLSMHCSLSCIPYRSNFLTILQQSVRSRYEAMRDALNRTGRPIAFSMCEWGVSAPWEYGHQVPRRLPLRPGQYFHSRMVRKPDI